MRQNRVYRKSGRALTKGKILHIFLINLIFSVVVGLVSSLSASYGPQINPETFVVISQGNPFLNFSFTVLTFFVAGYAAYGMMKVFITVSKDELPIIDKSLVASVKEQPIKAPLLSLVANALLALWTLLFVIPGLIKSYSYAMATFILVNEPKIEPLEAITKSRKLMDGKKLRLFLLDLSYLGWYFISLFTFGILTVWVASWHYTARALFFQDAYNPNKQFA
jgi:uncharacterized membrane protein